MGARPLTAMNLVAWPSDLDMAHLGEILRGGMEKVLEAGAELAGGHSIDDKEPKYGLAVTGVARPDEIVYNGGAAGRATSSCSPSASASACSPARSRTASSARRT